MEGRRCSLKSRIGTQKSILLIGKDGGQGATTAMSPFLLASVEAERKL